MSSSDYYLFWSESIRQLCDEQEISEQEIDMWFKNMEFVSGKNDIITISVPSRFYRDQVAQRYSGAIQTRLKELTGSSITINFSINENKKSLHNHEHTEPVHTSTVTVPAPKLNPVHRARHTQLQEDYNFSAFVIGNNNSFAANAAKAISLKPGSSYNPFLIYGGVGLGKTHLMQAIGNEIYQKHQEKKVIYISSETFINEFIHSIRTNTQRKFKSIYRKIDVLLIDDIHDLQKTKETQEEFFNTFNALYDNKKQLVFTCDRPPSELKQFTDRLRNRFERGLNVDIQPPDYETRYAILKKKLETVSHPIRISDMVLEHIARKITTNVRDLEASLIKMTAYSDLIGKEVTIEIAEEQLKNSFSSNSIGITSIETIQKVVSEYFNITPGELKGKRKTKSIVFPRQVAMYISREITDHSTTEIGDEFGGRDHTTVIHSCQRIDDALKSDSTLEPLISQLIRTIKENS